MNKIYLSLFLALLISAQATVSWAQDNVGEPMTDYVLEAATSAATVSPEAAEQVPVTRANNIINLTQNPLLSTDLTQPQERDENAEMLTLFDSRLVTELGTFNFMAYWVQEAVRMGIPVNTIFLILLTPLLTLIVSFTRVVIGLPTLDMLVPIALAFALVAVGITVGLLVLAAILVASYVSKVSLSRLRIMFYPKRSLSMLFLAMAVFAALTIGVLFEFERILSVSIFPILILMLLGDMIVSVQLHKSAQETFLITGTTIAIGLAGYFAATSTAVQNLIILYPEIVLLVIPANILVGRYFGLRALEMLRFNKVEVE